MEVVYARQPFPARFDRAIFLAGPTPREASVASWRPRALELLRERGYDGVVFVPEDADGSRRFTYDDQIGWESEALALADAIVFWIPRQLDTLPGFTTNVEWGIWQRSGKVVLGAPADAPKLRYLQHHANALAIPQATELGATLDAALALIGPPAPRTGGEREVPLFIWRRPAFQRWYAAQRGAGHRLDGASFEWHYRSGSSRSLFCWALQVDVYIPEEDRHKRSEVILSREDISAVVAYAPAARVADTKVVLVREFRSNAATADGYVHELPGGSASHAPVNEAEERAVAAAELHEETGVQIAAERLVAHGARQCMATMITHRAALHSVALSPAELAVFEARIGQRFGENDSERTYVEVRSWAEILASRDVDWSHVGMIAAVLAGAPTPQRSPSPA